MEQQLIGVSIGNIPFISSILAPQLKLRKLPLYLVASLEEVTDVGASYTLLDGDQVLLQNAMYQQKLHSFLETQQTSVALIMDKSYKRKLELLEIGFHHCIEVPVATEVVIKTIENCVGKSVKPSLLKDQSISYQANTSLSYVHDKYGQYFLLNKRRSIFLNPNEQSVLEYLIKRKGFATRNELAYAGWKTFTIRPNTVTVTIKKLRAKIKHISLPYNIRNLYGFGYIIEKTEPE